MLSSLSFFTGDNNTNSNFNYGSGGCMCVMECLEVLDVSWNSINRIISSSTKNYL